MRRAYFALSYFIAGCVAYACAFPEVEFAQDFDGGTNDSASANASSSSSSGAPPVDDGGIIEAGELPVIIDGAVFDANFDAGGKVAFEAGCDSCDCDGDGYLNGLDAGCEPTDGAVDCDDFDSRTHPGASFYAFPPESPRYGDWDCKNGVEKFPADKFDCSKLTAALLSSKCESYSGFVDSVECGSKGTYVICKSPLLGLGNCTIGTIGTATAVCR